MEIAGLLLSGVGGLIGGILVGLKWGERLRGKPARTYWMANAVVMVVGMALVFVDFLLGMGWLFVAGIAVMGGGVTGLKYGLGKTVGVWRTVDRVTGVDDLPEE